MSHPPEPWTAHENPVTDRWEIDHAGDGSLGGEFFEEEANRICACVNFCRHLKLEDMLGRVAAVAAEDRPGFRLGETLADIPGFAGLLPVCKEKP